MKQKRNIFLLILLTVAAFLLIQLANKKGNIDGEELKLKASMETLTAAPWIKIVKGDDCAIISIDNGEIEKSCTVDPRSYPLDSDKIKSFKRKLSTLSIAHEVSNAKKDSVLLLFENGIKVCYSLGNVEQGMDCLEFAGDFGLEDGFYVRRYHSKEGKKEVFKLRSSASDKNFTSLFTANVGEWRSNLVTDFTVGKIKKIELKNYKNQEQSFKLDVSNEKITLFDYQAREINGSYSSLVAYLQSFNQLKVTKMVTHDVLSEQCFEPGDNLLFELKVEKEMKGSIIKTEELTFKAKCAKPGEKLLDGSPKVIDNQELYLEKGDDTFVLPYLAVEELLLNAEDLLNE